MGNKNDPSKFHIWLSYYVIKPTLKLFIIFLDLLFKVIRKKINPLYPYDKETKTIILPQNIQKEIYQLVKSGKKVEAVKRVTYFTGAGLMVSKDYVDTLESKNNNH